MNPKDEAQASVVDQALRHKIVLCVGPGGVGKTTTSAALALAAARRGQRVLVITIDPARRLADALGVVLGNTPSRVAWACSEEGATGSLDAMMLEPGDAFDALVQELSPNPEAAQRLLGNRVYRQISRAMAGTLEYTAVDRLYGLHIGGAYDLIVVDTPPSKNALDFLEAPDYLSRFLDERIQRWFLLGGGGDGASQDDGGGFLRGAANLGQRLVRRTGRMVWDLLARILGQDFVAAIVEFLGAMQSISGAVRRRAEATRALLQSKKTLAFAVSSSEHGALCEAVFLFRQLKAHRIPQGGFILNRMVPCLSEDGFEQAAGELSQVCAKFDPNSDPNSDSSDASDASLEAMAPMLRSVLMQQNALHRRQMAASRWLENQSDGAMSVRWLYRFASGLAPQESLQALAAELEKNTPLSFALSAGGPL